MNKLVKHSDTRWSLFYTPYGVRHCVDMIVKNNKVVEVETVWVCTEDGYNDCIINDMKKYYADYHNLLNKTLEDFL